MTPGTTLPGSQVPGSASQAGPILDSISVGRASWRRQLTIAFALMSIIPLLTFTYFATAYLLPEMATTENLFLVMLLNVLVVSVGFLLLWKTGRHLTQLADCIRRVAAGTFSREMALSFADSATSGAELTRIGEALVSIVETLQRDRLTLAETSTRLEAEVRARTQDVIRANEALSTSNMELSNALEEIRKTQGRLIAQERMNALTQMASGIAHDFNNTLMPIVGLSHFLLSHPEILDDRAELLDTLKDIRSAGEDAKKVVARLREFYRSDTSATLLPVRIEELLDAAIETTQPKWKEEMQARNVSIQIRRQYLTTPSFHGNAALLREVFVNMILNAVDASPNGGTITLSTCEKGGRIHVRITDEGVGMDAEACRRCIEPFYTTKNDQGSGLGLSVCYGIIRRHSGTLTIDSEPGRGTTIEVQLPVAPLEKAAETVAGSLPEGLHVLVVEDDPRSRKFISRILASWRLVATFAADGREGIATFATGKFDCVITDRAMPDMSGDALADGVRARSPHTPIVMVTGFGDMMKARAECPESVDALVAKPVEEDELRVALLTAFARHKPTDRGGK